MYSLLITASFVAAVLACPQHTGSFAKRAGAANDWAYDASYDWGKINPDYSLCQTGTHQSPIQLSLKSGFSKVHSPTFDYSKPVSGKLANWGFGLGFNVDSKNVTSTNSTPSMTYDGTTVFLQGWHIHAPADHSVDGNRSKAELHLVHGTADGKTAAVLGFMIDAVPIKSNSTSAFFSSLGPASSFPSWTNKTEIPMKLDMGAVLKEVDGYKNFWTYEGSLTSPPCTEGIRWYVAGSILRLGTDQMKALLGISTFSARVEQEAWGHEVNV